MTYRRWADDIGTHYFIATNWFIIEFTWQRGIW